jgi:hypothetical protein
MALCPAHKDRKPSLSIAKGSDGRVLLYCHAGCKYESIVEALGLSPPKPERNHEREIVATYPYVDESGKLLFEVVRYKPKDFAQRRPDGHGGWIWNLNGVRRVLYKLPDVLRAVRSGETIFLVEGEKDAEALSALGLVATTNPHGAGKWRDEYSQTLKGAHVIILPDKDESGRRHAESVALSLWGKAKTIKVVELPGDGIKDVSDWLKAGGTREQLLELVAQAPEWKPPASEPEKGKRYLAAVWKPLGEITMPAHDAWQVEGLIKPGNLVLLSARPKTAKSIVALNLAACVASGRPFLDRSVRQGRALFVAFERHDLTVQRAWEMGLAECRDFMLWDKHAWGLPRVEALDFWLEFIEKHGVTLFIVDTLAHFLRPELELVRNAINAYDYIYAVMEKLQAGASDTGCTFLLIHHDRKGEGDTDEQRVLGTTALTAAVDAVFQLKPVGDGVICLKATGNAFDDTTFFFTIGEDNGMELAEKPATTKEERAARAIEDYLRQHSEATRQQLIDHLREVGLAESRVTAGKLVDRALQDRLMTRVEKEHRGRESVYRWKGGSWTSETFIGNVPGVHRRIVDIVDNRDIVDNGHDVHDVHGWQRWTMWTNPIGVSDVSNPEPDPQAEPDSYDDHTY